MAELGASVNTLLSAPSRRLAFESSRLSLRNKIEKNAVHIRVNVNTFACIKLCLLSLRMAYCSLDKLVFFFKVGPSVLSSERQRRKTLMHKATQY